MMWREHRVPLVIIAVLLLGNIFFFFTYRVQYQARLRDLETRQEQAQARLAEAQRTRMSAEAQLAAYDKVRHDLQMLYDERWSTQAKRFTRLFEEVKKLATASHFDPRSFSFGRSALAQTVKEPSGESNTVVSVTFGVQGSYEQVRQLINLLELSDQFVIIDGIGLSGNDPKLLNMNIRLKTMFREPNATALQRVNRQL
jgi:hypothetical protein